MVEIGLRIGLYHHHHHHHGEDGSSFLNVDISLIVLAETTIGQTVVYRNYSICEIKFP